MLCALPLPFCCSGGFAVCFGCIWLLFKQVVAEGACRAHSKRAVLVRAARWCWRQEICTITKHNLDVLCVY